MTNAKSVHRASPRQADTVADIVGFPFENFEQLQAAVAIRSFNIGVDPLAAAEWSGRLNSRLKKTIIAALSLLLVAAAAASIVGAFLTGEYWLLLAPPIQATAFYVSQPASGIRKWVTVGGVISLAAFVDLLLNGLVVAAALVAYAGLTFASVRAASYVTNSSFRKALLRDELLFVTAYAGQACTIRNNRTNRVHSA
jgi:hypothetical protein